MSLIIPINNKTPRLGQGVYVAQNATLIGDLSIGDESSIWFGVVIRADVNQIEIGNNTNIQDATVIHATYQTHSTWIGDNVTVGHSCLLHGCKIGSYSLIGMGSIVMDGADIGDYSLVGAGSLVTERKKFEPYSLIVGRPAVFKRKLTDQEVQALKQSAKNYLLYKTWYT